MWAAMWTKEKKAMDPISEVASIEELPVDATPTRRSWEDIHDSEKRDHIQEEAIV